MSFERFLERYGHRGHYESDWALPRLREDPAPVLFAIRAHISRARRRILPRRRAPGSRSGRGVARIRGASDRRGSDGRCCRASARSLRRLKQQYVWREQVRSDLTRVLSTVRTLASVLADRFVERGWIDRRDDYFLLELDEVRRGVADPAQRPGLRAIVASARRAARRRARPADAAADARVGAADAARGAPADAVGRPVQDARSPACASALVSSKRRSS